MIAARNNRRLTEKKRRRHTSRVQRRRRAFYALISPWLIGFVLLGVIPLVVGFLVSFTNYDGLNVANVKFLALRNYERALNDPNVKHALSRTGLWTALNLPLWLVLSFLLALVLNRKIKGVGIFRTLFYIPSVIPTVALVWIWKIFLEQNYGLLNGIISLFRPGTAIPWLSAHAIYGLTAVAVWSGLGAGMIVFLAGLQDIPDELMDAARVDGANYLQTLRYVILPMMTPIIFFQLVLGLITSFQQFIIPQLLTTSATRSIPPRSAYLYMVHVYRQIFSDARFGYGMALLWILILIIALLTWVVFRTQRFWVHSNVEEQT